jgi:hypothetical protein
MLPGKKLLGHLSQMLRSYYQKNCMSHAYVAQPVREAYRLHIDISYIVCLDIYNKSYESKRQKKTHNNLE